MNRISAKPTVTSGLNLHDLGFEMTPSNPTAAGLPFITVTGFFTTGDAQQPFATRENNVFGVTDDLTWIRGAHAFKFGGELRRDQIKVSFINRPNGDFTFTGQYTGNAAADFLIGFPCSTGRQRRSEPRRIVVGLRGVYAQDEFRLSRLTVNAGLRYEVNQPFAERQDHLNAFHPGEQSVVFPTAPTGLVYPGDAGVPRGTYPTDANNVAPRLAAVWDVRGDARTALRTAWGLFYDTLPGQGDFFQNGTLAPPFQPLTEVNYPLQMTSSPFANPLARRRRGARLPARTDLHRLGTRLRDAHRAAVQRDAAAAGRQQVGARGRLRRFARQEPADLHGGEPDDSDPLARCRRSGRALFPAFSLVRPTFSVAESWYDSLQTSARMRAWRGLNVLASYTLGHAVDHVSGLNIGGESRPMLPVTIGDQASIDAALAREKGDALFDVRHRFVLSFGYELPRLEATRRAAGAGGWQVNGIVQAQTGFPLTVDRAATGAR